MELSDISKSLSEASEEELRKMLIDIRNSRRTPKSRPVARPVAAREAKAKKETSFDSLVNAMSTDQIEALLKQLGG